VEQFEDKVLQILSAASAVSLVIGIIEEGWATVITYDEYGRLIRTRVG